MSNGRKTIGSGDNNARLATSDDIKLVTLSDADNFIFSDDRKEIMPRGFYTDTDGAVSIETAVGAIRVITVIAHKDYLIAVNKFRVTGTNIGGGQIFAFS
jgi:hypothetical protein